MTCDAQFKTRTRDDVCEHCVKFCDNRLRNEVCRVVTKFQGGSPLLWVLHVTCDAHVQTHTRDNVCEQVCEVS